jgi:leader peptidase (prepilin peptidase) / N-methyltransferase
VPGVMSLPGIVAGLVFSVVARYVINDPLELIPSPLSALIGILVGGGFLLALAWAYEAFTGVEGLGGGDIKLLAMIGCFSWLDVDSVYAFFASLAGSVIGLGFMIWKSRLPLFSAWERSYTYSSVANSCNSTFPLEGFSKN